MVKKDLMYPYFQHAKAYAIKASYSEVEGNFRLLYS